MTTSPLGLGTALLLLLPSTVLAQDALTVLEARLDPPTLHALGVQVLISGEANRSARITVRYRPVGGTWREGPPLFRVLPETSAVAVPEQCAGSVFDLAPGTTYALELHARDPDGGVDQLLLLAAITRPVPRAEPASPRVAPVSSAAELKAALSAAKAGDVMTLALGTYAEGLSGTALGGLLRREGLHEEQLRAWRAAAPAPRRATRSPRPW